jgi:hypothetical protein
MLRYAKVTPMRLWGPRVPNSLMPIVGTMVREQCAHCRPGSDPPVGSGGFGCATAKGPVIAASRPLTAGSGTGALAHDASRHRSRVAHRSTAATLRPGPVTPFTQINAARRKAAPAHPSPPTRGHSARDSRALRARLADTQRATRGAAHGTGRAGGAMPPTRPGACRSVGVGQNSMSPPKSSSTGSSAASSSSPPPMSSSKKASAMAVPMNAPATPASRPPAIMLPMPGPRLPP